MYPSPSFFLNSLNPSYKLLTWCRRVIHKSWHYKYYNNLMHKMSPISLKCCLKAHVTYESGEFPCLHLNEPLFQFWLQRSQLNRTTCFIGVTPVWAQGTKNKQTKKEFTETFFCCFLKIKKKTWDTSATGKTHHFQQKNRWISQIILCMPKTILTIKQHSQKPETCHLEKLEVI